MNIEEGETKHLTHNKKWIRTRVNAQNRNKSRTHEDRGLFMSLVIIAKATASQLH